MTGYLWRGKPGLIDLNAAIMAARDPETTRPVQPFEWGTHAVCGGHRNRHAFYRTRHGDTQRVPSATLDGCSSPSPKPAKSCTQPSADDGSAPSSPSYQDSSPPARNTADDPDDPHPPTSGKTSHDSTPR